MYLLKEITLCWAFKEGRREAPVMSPWNMALTWMWRNLGRLIFSPSLAGVLGFLTASPVNVSALLTSCTVSKLRLQNNPNKSLIQFFKVLQVHVHYNPLDSSIFKTKSITLTSDLYETDLDLETGLLNSCRVLEICLEPLVIIPCKTTGCWGISTSISPTEIMAELCSLPFLRMVVWIAWVLSMVMVTTVL